MGEPNPSTSDSSELPPGKVGRYGRLSVGAGVLAALAAASMAADWLLLAGGVQWGPVLAGRLALLAVIGGGALAARLGADRLFWDHPVAASFLLAATGAASFGWCAAHAGVRTPIYLAGVDLIVIVWCFLLADTLKARLAGGFTLFFLFGAVLLGFAPVRPPLPEPAAHGWLPALVLVAGVVVAEYAQRSRGGELRKAWERTKTLATTDEVTGLFNTRYMREALEREVYRSRRYGTPLSLIFVDLDYFKRVNDTHGHLIGTKLLREVGVVLQANLRESDYAVRYGGDEFVLILPGTNKEQAEVVAERVRVAIHEERFLTQESLSLNVTASLGVASHDQEDSEANTLLSRADQAMYWVKGHGRDGVHGA